MRPQLKIFKIPNMNIIVIKQMEGGKFFVSTKDSIVIDIFGLSALLKFLLFSGMLHKRVLEGLIGEYDDFNSDKS